MLWIRASLALLAAAAAMTVALASCGGFGGTGLTTSGLPNITAQNAFRVVGITGTPFSGVISDYTASWAVSGTVPFTIAILNGNPPFKMIATKTSADSNLLSVEVLQGSKPGMISSTSQPFGITSAQTGGTLTGIAPRAEPDVRFYLRGPRYVLFSGLIEDNKHSIAVEQRVPTVFLFESPQGTIDGQFNDLNPGAGKALIDLYYAIPPNGTVVCRGVSTNGSLTLKYPGCTAQPLGHAEALDAGLLPLGSPD
jgi:hypothetical protein